MDNVIAASAELIAIIERNFESKGLDYKGPVEWNSGDKKACCELAKDIIGMANTEGGYIVIGVSELDEGFSLDGVNAEQARSFESSEVCRFVQNYVDPPINVRILKIVHNLKLFIVISVPKFPDTPHICQKTYPDVLRDRELYVRTDNNETAPIKSSSDFRLLIESAIRNRADSLLSSFRAILTGPGPNSQQQPSAEELFRPQIESARSGFDQRNPLTEKPYTFFVETIFFPETFDPYRFPRRKLELAAHNASVDFTGWPFLFIHQNRTDFLSSTENGLESLISTEDFGGHDMLDFWRLNESGLFYKKELSSDAVSIQAVALVPNITRHFAEAIFCLTRLYESLISDSEVISLSVTFFGTRDRSLVWRKIPAIPIPFSNSYQASRPELASSRSLTLAEWRIGIEDYAVQATKDILAGFHYPNPDLEEIRTYVQKLFQRKL